MIMMVAPYLYLPLFAKCQPPPTRYTQDPPHVMRISVLLFALSALAFAACDSGFTDALCGPLASVSLASTQKNTSIAVQDATGCRLEEAIAVFGDSSLLKGPIEEYELVPTFLIEVRGPLNNGVRLHLGLRGTDIPEPGRYLIADLRGDDGRFGFYPVQFAPGDFASLTSNGDGQGHWFATGGEIIIERSDGEVVAGTFESTYLHGAGDRPITVRGRFQAQAGTPAWGQNSNGYGG